MPDFSDFDFEPKPKGYDLLVYVTTIVVTITVFLLPWCLCAAVVFFTFRFLNWLF